MQSNVCDEWNEFVEDSDPSSGNLQTNGMAELAENVNIQNNNNITVNTSSSSDADNTVCSERDDAVDDWCEVEERPSGVTDTLFQDPDIAANADKISSFAPGEGNKPLGVFIDKDSEYLSFPSIFRGKQRCENNEKNVPVSYSTVQQNLQRNGMLSF